MDTPVIDWLMDGGPAIRRQVQHDLLGADPDTVAAERARARTTVGSLATPNRLSVPAST